MSQLVISAAIVQPFSFQCQQWLDNFYIYSTLSTDLVLKSHTKAVGNPTMAHSLICGLFKDFKALPGKSSVGKLRATQIHRSSQSIQLEAKCGWD